MKRASKKFKEQPSVEKVIVAVFRYAADVIVDEYLLQWCTIIAGIYFDTLIRLQTAIK
ncbi:hypothetical protein PGB90_009008 [Kerria lacca]